MKTALITGVTGQDGSYLAEFLLQKGYVVHGIKRRSSSFNTDRIDHIYQDPQINNRNFILHYGDLTDTSNIISLLNKIKPDEVYNLAAQSHVAVSFELPEYTSNVDALGTLRLLEGIKILKKLKECRFYQASTSELYGKVKETPQNELTPFYPRSPYAVAKLYAYWMTINYREAYGIFACNGILFNHESKRRGETFVTRKITRQMTRIYEGLEKSVFLGNLDSLRDWGHANDYVKMQWLMLQQKHPKDYVIATGKQVSVRTFVEKVAKILGLEINWFGSGKNEKGKIKKINKPNSNIKIGDIIIEVDERYYRPTEVENLLGNSEKAAKELGWTPEISLDEMIAEMVNNDLQKAKQEKLIKKTRL